MTEESKGKLVIITGKDAPLSEENPGFARGIKLIRDVIVDLGPLVIMKDDKDPREEEIKP